LVKVTNRREARQPVAREVPQTAGNRNFKGEIMAVLKIDRKAADNKYLHRDFHVSGDAGLAYVGKRFGDAGVTEYLERFSRAMYAPLAGEIKKEGLKALKAHIEKIYEIEEMPEVLHTTLHDGELLVMVDRCPALTYFRSINYKPSKWYKELTATVNRVIADMAGCRFEMQAYDESTGQAAYRFYK
jgi:hypothetical protein